MQGIKGVSKVYGGTFPAQTWKAFMAEAMKGVDTPDFPPPAPLLADLAPGNRRSPTPPPDGNFVVVGAPIAPVTTPSTTVAPSPSPTLVPPNPILPLPLPGMPTTVPGP